MVRFKHRYLVATVAASPRTVAKLSQKDILMMLKESIAANFGDYGAGCAAGCNATPLQVRSFDRRSGVCIIRAGRESHRIVRASLTLVTGLKDTPVSITVEGVAGCDRTLRAAGMQAYARGYRRAGIGEDRAAKLLQQQRQHLGGLQ